MILKGKKVVLRPIEQGDLEFIRSLINNPDIEKSIVGWALPISKKDEENWFSSFKNTEKAIRYIIEDTQGHTVGLTGIGNIDMKNGCAKDLGIRIAPEVQSKGLATDAYMTMFNYAFHELRLHRIETSAIEDNIASLKFQEKIGCRREGLRREAIYKQGEYKNIVTLGCLKSDFEEKYKTYMSNSSK